MAWVRGLNQRGTFGRDVLIVAGDVTPSLVNFEQTFTILVQTFAAVFFVPGNHDLWVKVCACPLPACVTGPLEVRTLVTRPGQSQDTLATRVLLRYAIFDLSCAGRGK